MHFPEGRRFTLKPFFYAYLQKCKCVSFDIGALPLNHGKHWLAWKECSRTLDTLKDKPNLLKVVSHLSFLKRKRQCFLRKTHFTFPFPTLVLCGKRTYHISLWRGAHSKLKPFKALLDIKGVLLSTLQGGLWMRSTCSLKADLAFS